MTTMRQLYSELVDTGYNVKQYDNNFTVEGEYFVVSVTFREGANCSNKFDFQGWETDNAEVGVWERNAKTKWVSIGKYVTAGFKRRTSIMRYIRRYAPLS